MSTFLETFAALIAACALSAWLGWVSRDGEIKAVEVERDYWMDAATEQRNRADNAEAHLQKRGANGRFTKKEK